MLDWSYIFVLFLSFLLSLALTPVIIAVSHRFSIYDYPGKHKRHKKPTPILGGTAVTLAVWAGLAVFLFIKAEALGDIRAALPHILAGSIIIYIVGLIDDLRPLSAWVKLAAEVAAGLALYIGGLSVDFISLPVLGSVPLDGLSMLITVFWVVALTNAINLIDGLDGLASGVSVIAAGATALLGWLFLIDSVIIISLALLGALLGFWFFNRYPARVFLGDCGSLQIGFFFAVISLIVPIKSFTTAALFIPLVALGVPLTETISSFLRRLAAGRNVMEADRRHIFHYLLHFGLSPRQIVVLFYLSSLFFGLISVSMFFFKRTAVLTILILFMVVIFVIYFIFISRIRRSSAAK
jgi:UDP-GlcNAc:undecaprenyl-phosphate GlcNAc-1-phosphate transferase